MIPFFSFESLKTVWEEYQFKCKPGDVNRRPCIAAPYHYRIDWQIWFAAMQRYEHNPCTAPQRTTVLSLSWLIVGSFFLFRQGWYILSPNSWKEMNSH